jgi:hypothetical protein
MFAAVMTYAMGVKVENIRQGLRTFDTTYFQAPGRLNVYDELPFKVILDYGHNPAAVRAMAALVGASTSRASASACSRPPATAATTTSGRSPAARQAFDHFIIREDDGLRGRAAGEVANLLAAELRALGVSDDQVSLLFDEQQAIDAGLAAVPPRRPPPHLRRQHLALLEADRPVPRDHPPEPATRQPPVDRRQPRRDPDGASRHDRHTRPRPRAGPHHPVPADQQRRRRGHPRRPHRAQRRLTPRRPPLCASRTAADSPARTSTSRRPARSPR